MWAEKRFNQNLQPLWYKAHQITVAYVTAKACTSFLRAFSQLKMIYPGLNQLMILQTCSFSPWFGFFSHRKTQVNQNVSLTTLTNHVRTFSLLIKPDVSGLGSTKVVTVHTNIWRCGLLICGKIGGSMPFSTTLWQETEPQVVRVWTSG